MSNIGRIERETQNRAIELFQKELGYRYLGNWEERENNSNTEEGILLPVKRGESSGIRREAGKV